MEELSRTARLLQGLVYRIPKGDISLLTKLLSS